MDPGRSLSSYPEVLLPEEAATILQVGRNTIYRMLKNKTLKSIRIGKLYRIPRQYLLEYLNAEDI